MHPVRHMGYHADLRKNSRTQTSRAAKEKNSFTLVDQSTRLHDQLKSEKPISKTDDLHHEVKLNRGDTQLFPGKPLGNCQKQFSERKARDDELVKHMSNLPCYLQREERAKNLQEKVFNFGVLDWTRLENWKYNQKTVTHRSTMYSPSTSNTSSPFSTVGSSTLSTRSDSGIQAHRKISPSRVADLASSSNDSHSVIEKPTKDIRASLKDKTTIFKNSTKVFNQRNQIKAKLEKGMQNEVNSNFSKEIGSSSSSSKSGEVPFSPKGKTKVPKGAYTQRTEQFQEPTSAGQHCPGRNKTIVLLLPKNLPNKRLSSPSRMSIDSRQSETSRSSFSDGLCIHEGVQYSKVHSEIPYSCPQLSKTVPNKQFNLILPRSLDVVFSKDPASMSLPPRRSTETHYVRSQCIQAEESKLITKSKDLMAMGHLKGSYLNAEASLFARSRNQSPNRWTSVGKGKISRTLSFKEGSDFPQLSSSYVTTKSGPVGSDLYSNTPSKEKMTSKTRSQSSPLRRLLDPLLRPRIVSRLPSVILLHDEAHKVRKLSDWLVPAPAQTVKRIINISSSTPADANSAHQDENHEVSMVQALLQVTVKNGLPWFTFAVDNNSDILAAIMRKTSTNEKYDCSWIYTFYSFRKSKKKGGGWMGQGSKTASSDYVHNIVGQMKVNGSQTNRHLTVREFVLLDVEPRKADEEATLSAELAGIVIKVLTESNGIVTSDREQSNNHNDLSRSLDKNHSDNSIGNLWSEPTVGSQSLPSIVVVLPTDIHGLSPTRLPSPLLDRWRSGGSCDCGGWDLGCQLRVFSNQEQTKNSDSVDLCGDQDKFDLYVEGGGSRERLPSLSFVTFNKGVHSVDFNSPISPLQAFSISIAFLHCKNLAKVSNLFQETSAPEPTLMKSKIIHPIS